MFEKCYSQKKESIFIVILLGMSAVSGIASDMYIAAFPEMGSYFDVSSVSIKWTMSLFFVGLSISQLIYGPLSDYIGRKKIMIFGFVVFSIGCLVCIISKIFLIFLVGRFVQGCGAGATTCISRAIMRDTYEGPALSKALSYIGMGLAIVPAIAPIMGSYIQYIVGWKCEFLFMLLYTLALFCVAISTISETNPYIFQNKKSIKDIILDYRKTLIDPEFFINVLVASLNVSMIYIFYTITSFYLQKNFNWNEIQYSQISIVIAISLFIGRKFNIILSKSFSNNKVILFGCIFSLLSSIIMYIFYLLNFNIIIILVPPISIYAIAGGIIFSNTFVGATEKYTKTVGSVSSLYGFSQMLTVFAIMALSTLLGLTTIKSIYCSLFFSSIVSIALVLFLIKSCD